MIINLWLNLVLLIFLATETTLNVLDSTSLATCGRDSVPYSITVDLNGHPELFCESPSCFGRFKKPERRISNGGFLAGDENSHNLDDNFGNNGATINDRFNNLFLRRRRRLRLKRHRVHRRAAIPLNRLAECSGTFTNTVCAGPDEWTGGLTEFNNGTHISLHMECCRVNGFPTYAYELKNIILRPGDHYTGGVFHDEQGRQMAFDVIKEVRKNVTELNNVIYIITIYRMSCPSMNFQSKGEALTYSRLSDRRTLMEARHRGEQLPHMNRIARPPGYYGRIEERGNSYSEEDKKQHRKENRITQMFPHRKQYYRPIVDDYDYYDIEPKMSIYRRRQAYRKSRNKYGEEQLWPISYNLASSKGETTIRPRLFNGGAYEPIQDNQITFKPEEDYQVPETEVSPSFNFNKHQLSYRAPQQIEPSNNYVTLVPNTVKPLQPLLEGYPTVNSYVPFSVPFETSTIQALTIYETQPQQQQYIQPQFIQQHQQQQTFSTSSGCTNQCSASTTPCATGGSCCCPNMNSIFSSLQCFSGDMTVNTPNGPKRIDELKIGEKVLSIDQNMIMYSPIVMFLHRKTFENGDYRLLKTQSGQILKLTEFHLIYVSECTFRAKLKLKYARDLRVGQCVQALSNNQNIQNIHTPILISTKIVEITQIEERGIYAPLTANGNIIVNGILASCHTNMAIQTLQQTFFAWWRNIHSWIEILLVFLNPIRSVISSTMHQFSLKTNVENFQQVSIDELPFGVEYVISILDIFVPQTIYS